MSEIQHLVVPEKLGLREKIFKLGHEIDDRSRKDATWGDALKMGSFVCLCAGAFAGGAAVVIHEKPILIADAAVAQKLMEPVLTNWDKMSTGEVLQQIIKVGTGVAGTDQFIRAADTLQTVLGEKNNTTIQVLQRIMVANGVNSVVFLTAGLVLDQLNKPLKKGVKMSTHVGPALAKLCKFIGTNSNSKSL